jgi:hypothetical protein
MVEPSDRLLDWQEFVPRSRSHSGLAEWRGERMVSWSLHVHLVMLGLM